MLFCVVWLLETIQCVWHVLNKYPYIPGTYRYITVCTFSLSMYRYIPVHTSIYRYAPGSKQIPCSCTTGHDSRCVYLNRWMMYLQMNNWKGPYLSIYWNIVVYTSIHQIIPFKVFTSIYYDVHFIFTGSICQLHDMLMLVYTSIHWSYAKSTRYVP